MLKYLSFRILSFYKPHLSRFIIRLMEFFSRHDGQPLRYRLRFVYVVLLLLPIVEVRAEDILIVKGKQEMRAKNFTKGITYFSKARHAALASNDYRTLFEAEMGFGICYSSVGDFGQAVTHFYAAQKISSDHRLGWEENTRVKNALAGVYYEHGNYKQATIMLQSCLKAAISHAASADIVAYALNLVRVNLKMNNIPQALHYMTIVRQYAGGRKDVSHLTIRFMEANILYHQKHYHQFVDVATPLLHEKSFMQTDKDELLLNLLRAYKTMGMIEEALKLAHEELSNSVYENRTEIFSWLSDLYRGLGDEEKALEMSDSVVQSLTIQQEKYNRQQAENLQYRTEMLQAMMSIDKAVASAQYRQKIYLLLIALCLLVIVMAFLFIVLQRQRSRQRHQLFEMEMRETELQTKYQKSLMKMEMDKQTHELSAMSVFLSSRNLIINDLLQRLQSIESLRSVKEVNDIVLHLRDMLKQVNDRDKYITHFEASHPGLLNKLKKLHPGLTTSDLQFLAYVSMNLSNQDIASLMNITPDSSKKRRTRISKKLGLESSSKLYEYVIGL